MKAPARASARLRRAAIEAPLSRHAFRGVESVLHFERARLVTLDVFDTALLRNVERPSDVFALAAWRFAARRNRPAEVRGFVAARRSAEAMARAAARASGRGEVTLAEIYAVLAERGGLGEDDRDALAAEELATECDVSVANPELLALCRELHARGRTVAFLSDTYLPERVVEELLSAAGYPQPVRVFTSAAFGKTKASGDLYAEVAHATGIDVADLVHVGDNAVNDVRNAHRAGAAALWYSRRARGRRTTPRDPEDGENALAVSVLRGLANAAPARNEAAALAAEVAAPMYLGLAQWILTTLERTAPDAILFCARDGLIVKRVYDKLRPLYPNSPRSVYFLGSRRALVFPSFTHIGERELDFLCGNPVPLAVRAYLDRIGFDGERYAPALAAAGLELDDQIGTPERRRMLGDFFSRIAADVLAAAATERTLLLRYLDELGCAGWSRIAVCDIGWHGSLQRALTAVLRAAGREVDVEGYYLGLNDQMRPDPVSSMHGWLWDAQDDADAMHTQCDGREVVELFFTARHPTVIGRAAGSRRTYAIFDRAAELDADNRAAASAIQEAALRLVDGYVKAFGGTRPARIAKREAYARVRRLIERPSAKEVAFLGDLVHVAGFGTTRSGEPLARPPSVLGALRRPKHFMGAYDRAHWPSGFLTAFGGTWRFAAAQRRVSWVLRKALGYIS